VSKVVLMVQIWTFWGFLRPSSILSRTLLATVVVFGVLQIWRPYYFLTDDNLCVGLPFLTEMGRHLKSGQSPFFSDYLFGGHYNWLRDVMYFDWSPITLLTSLLADTPGRFFMFDLIALLNLLLASSGFLILAKSMREELQLEISDGRLVFLTLSFVYSTFILTCGASWANFLTNQASLPWLVLGLWRRSLGVLILFSLHQALGGQAAVTISNSLILLLFAMVFCLHRRSFLTLVYWVTGNVITLLLISPILLPAFGGFLQSQRAGGLPVDQLNSLAMPAALFPLSFLFGNCFEMIARVGGIHDATLFLFPRMPTLLASAAAWCVFPALSKRRPWTLLEIGCAGLICLLVLFVVRPFGITTWMSQVPIVRSMRWPFREILQLLFCFHLLLVLRPWAGSVSTQNRIAWISLILFALPLFFTRPLSFNPLLADRQAVFSGEGEQFWFRVKTLLSPTDRIATVIEPKIWYRSLIQMPYSLAGTADFPAYYRVPCISGYSQTAPLGQLAIPVRPYYWFGAYAPSQIPLITKGHPELRIIRVEGINPLRLSLSNRIGPPTDLTPLLKDL
jgi:hypothetical protein